MHLATIDTTFSQQADWSEAVFITLDIDWACDEALAFSLDLLAAHEAPATVFVTHQTPLLERMRRSPNLELGIHPNFNPLLQGIASPCGSNCGEILDTWCQLVPEAVSVRSHSLTHSSILHRELQQRGLRYDLNLLLPFEAGMLNRPFRWPGESLLRLPFFWEDDVHIATSSAADLPHMLAYAGLKIFGFHPIHLFLNSDTMQRYEGARPYFHQPDELRRHENRQAYGARDFLLDLLAAVPERR